MGLEVGPKFEIFFLFFILILNLIITLRRDDVNLEVMDTPKCANQFRYNKVSTYSIHFMIIVLYYHTKIPIDFWCR